MAFKHDRQRKAVMAKLRSSRRGSIFIINPNFKGMLNRRDKELLYRTNRKILSGNV